MAVGRQYYVYIMTNRHNTVIYSGVTNNLARRVDEHKNGLGGIFTKKYKVCKLVYYEVTDNIYSALAREKQIKGGSRKKKIDLINSMNPDWKDLYEESCIDIATKSCRCEEGDLPDEAISSSSRRLLRSWCW